MSVISPTQRPGVLYLTYTASWCPLPHLHYVLMFVISPALRSDVRYLTTLRPGVRYLTTLRSDVLYLTYTASWCPLPHLHCVLVSFTSPTLRSDVRYITYTAF